MSARDAATLAFELALRAGMGVTEAEQVARATYENTKRVRARKAGR